METLSVFQHQTKEDKSNERGQLKFGEETVMTVPELPDIFTNVRRAFFIKKKPSPPQSGVTHPDTRLLRPQLAMENEYLEKVTVAGLHIEMAALWLDRSPLGGRDNISCDSRFIYDSFEHH